MNNDHEAWLSQLSDEYGRMVFTTAYRILGHVDDAEDALQEVFLKLLGARKEHGENRRRPRMGRLPAGDGLACGGGSSAQAEEA